MKKGEEKECCPKFNPKLWDNKKVVWKNKLFVKDRYFSAFHIPLNIGSVIKRNCKKIEEVKEPQKTL